jgi:rhodanese-related sulfurtransferase
LLRELDLRLVKAVDTHLHADHVTGLGELRDRTHCVTIMGEQSKADVVAMRVGDGDKVMIEGLSLDVMYTPGHTDDSYSYLMADRVFTGDTLLIRGTGRTDFQNGSARAQYDSIFGRLLKLPDETMVFPAHDYKGDTVSTIGEEKRYNPRLQVRSIDEYVELMNNLNLPNPKMMDVAVPANMRVGLAQEEIARRGWSVSATEAMALNGRPDVALVDLRERKEREKHGIIAGSLHAPYPELAANVRPGGMLHELARATGKRIIFYCAFGERSAMAVQAAQDAGLASACHIQGGIDAWNRASGPLLH